MCGVPSLAGSSAREPRLSGLCSSNAIRGSALRVAFVPRGSAFACTRYETLEQGAPRRHGPLPARSHLLETRGYWPGPEQQDRPPSVHCQIILFRPLSAICTCLRCPLAPIPLYVVMWGREESLVRGGGCKGAGGKSKVDGPWGCIRGRGERVAGLTWWVAREGCIGVSVSAGLRTGAADWGLGPGFWDLFRGGCCRRIERSRVARGTVAVGDERGGWRDGICRTEYMEEGRRIRCRSRHGRDGLRCASAEGVGFASTSSITTARREGGAIQSEHQATSCAA